MPEARSFVTFLGWLHEQVNRQDTIGDLARDAEGDDEAPDSASEFVTYVGSKGYGLSHEAAILAAAKYMNTPQTAE